MKMSLRYSKITLLSFRWTNCQGSKTNASDLKPVTTETWRVMKSLNILKLTRGNRGGKGNSIGKLYFKQNFVSETAYLNIQKDCNDGSLATKNASLKMVIPTRISHRQHTKALLLRSVNYDNLVKLQCRDNNLGETSRKQKQLMNSCLLNTRSVVNKTLIVKDFVVENDIDFMAISETWLHSEGDTVTIGELCPTGYKLLNVPRENTTGGGVGLLYKTGIKIHDRTAGVFTSFEHLDTLFISEENVRVIVIYRPPPSQTNGLTISLFFDEFTSFLEQINGTPEKLLILGDFNIHMDDSNDSETKQFGTLLEIFGFKQYVNKPTHNKGHTLDLVISRTDENFINNLNVFQPGISDHFAVCFRMTVQRPQWGKKIIMSRNIKSINVEQFIEDLSNSELFIGTTDLNSLADNYNNLKLVLDKHAPLKKRTITLRPKAPWYSIEIAEQKKMRRKLERKWRSTKSVQDRTAYVEQCFKVNCLIYSSKQSYYNQIIKENSKDQKTLFKTMCKLLQCNKETLYPTRTDAMTLAEEFATFFADKIAKILSDINKMDLDDTNINSVPQNDYCSSTFNEFCLVSIEDISELISKLPFKSCSLDPIPATLFRECQDLLLPIITNIVNVSLSDGLVPDNFKVAMILPTIKKPNANSEEFSNFRPVSNLSYISKVLEKAVALQLDHYLSENGLHETVQSAYKKHHSTETALVKIQNDILLSLDRNQAALLVFLDMSAAFDTVNHQKLLSRLSSRFGITGKALDWFKSYLTNRKFFVNINGSYSSVHSLDTGVPQGSVLGPLLYLLYTSPISDIIRNHNLNHHCYADDSQLYIFFRSNCLDELISSKNRIEDCIKNVNLWMLQNDLKLNQNKTEVLLIHSKFRPKPFLDSIKVGDEHISPKPSARNLGVVFNEHLTNDHQIKQVCRTSFHHLRNFSKIRKYLTVEATETLVHSFISSKLDYCNSLFHGSPKYLLEKLQSIQNAAARLILLSKKFEHVTPLLVKLHWLPVKLRIIFKILLLVYKALNNMTPTYITDLVHYRKSTYRLRSISSGLLHEPNSRLKTYGDRSFSVCAPKLWNHLPEKIRKSTSVANFKRQLKTHLFTQFLNDYQ